MIRNDDALKRVQELLDVAARLWVDNHSATDLIVTEAWSSPETLTNQFVAMATRSADKAKLPLVTVTSRA